jgi:predicted amidophosphoribosyltransferase
LAVCFLAQQVGFNMNDLIPTCAFCGNDIEYIDQCQSCEENTNADIEQHKIECHIDELTGEL